MKHLLPIFRNYLKLKISFLVIVFFWGLQPHVYGQITNNNSNKLMPRQRISINNDWRFYKYGSNEKPDTLIYDIRPEVKDNDDSKPADSKPTDAIEVSTNKFVLKPWILISGNSFIKSPEKRYSGPDWNPGSNFEFVKPGFNDLLWEKVELPHDWAIKGPFYSGPNPQVGGGMGRLPSPGVAWYRKKLDIHSTDEGKSIFLDVDGAMSYAIVWLNGHLVGGWPYGYNSWRLNLTPYINPGGENQLAIRLDNPNHSARWYPGGGIYRNVWLTKCNPVHIGHWGTFITTPHVSEGSADINIEIKIDNESDTNQQVNVITRIFELNPDGITKGKLITVFKPVKTKISKGNSEFVKGSVTIKKPKLWGPPPTQKPNRYVAVTTLTSRGKTLDQYETVFGIRSIEFNPDKGLFVNGERIQIKGVNQHHDLGSLGAAFNVRAAERQLEILREMGCNAIRMAHNPPAPELLELTDRMGFLVVNEIFDSWERKKTPHDFHLIFKDWHEQDLRSMVRRDRNCPSVIMWSIGNEVGEQYTGEDGAEIAKRLNEILKEEDTSRPSTSAMNYAKPYMPLPAAVDIISLNYQGEGIRQAPEFEGTDRIRTAPQYNAFHSQFPQKLILSSETASAFSSRGIYYFPVSEEISSPTRDGRGGNSKARQVSSYELYAVDFGSSADKVFSSIEKHPFVAGEFVWTGWDHLGEPTPYYDSRSTYCGIIDLAGFKKDRFYLYQSHWRPDFPMAHILPHWNWPDRIGEVTPVHVFTSGDEAELFLNGVSLGRKKKQMFEYRLRWDGVKYAPGELKVVAYKNGLKWAENFVKTTDKPIMLKSTVDRETILADGNDLAFITVQITDKDGFVVPLSNNLIEFTIDGPGEIVATDNGDPTNMDSFLENKKNAFNGLCLAIIKSKAGEKGKITVNIMSQGLDETNVIINSL